MPVVAIGSSGKSEGDVESVEPVEPGMPDDAPVLSGEPETIGTQAPEVGSYIDDASQYGTHDCEGASQYDCVSHEPVAGGSRLVSSVACTTPGVPVVGGGTKVTCVAPGDDETEVVMPGFPDVMTGVVVGLQATPLHVHAPLWVHRNEV